MSQARLPRMEPSTELITAHKGNNCDAHAALQTRDFSALPKHRVAFLYSLCVCVSVLVYLDSFYILYIFWQSGFRRMNQRHCRHPREQAHRHTTRWHQWDICWTSDTKRQRTPRARYEPRARRNLAENLAGTSPETRVIFRRRHVYPPVHLTLAVLVQEMRMRRRPACLPSQRQLPAATGSAG